MRASRAARALALGVAVAFPLSGCGTGFTASSGAGDGGAGGSSSGGGSADGSADGAGVSEGGNPSGDASSDVSAVDGGSGTGNAGVPCGPLTSCSGITPVCCLAATGPSCAHVQCGCDVQLDCASDADCVASSAGVCCIGSTQDATCTSGHPRARCQSQCSGGSQEMCDPKAPACEKGTCSTDTGDLQNADLPAGPYGVCK